MNLAEELAKPPALLCSLTATGFGDTRDPWMLKQNDLLDQGDSRLWRRHEVSWPVLLAGRTSTNFLLYSVVTEATPDLVESYGLSLIVYEHRLRLISASLDESVTLPKPFLVRDGATLKISMLQYEDARPAPNPETNRICVELYGFEVSRQTLAELLASPSLRALINSSGAL